MIPKAEIKRPPEITTTKQFVGATTNIFGPPVPKLQPKTVSNSPPKVLLEGARSAPYLPVKYIIHPNFFSHNLHRIIVELKYHNPIFVTIITNILIIFVVVFDTLIYILLTP
jgi:hypothetical protein